MYNLISYKCNNTIMYPDIYLRLCFNELYSITFQFPTEQEQEQFDESFRRKQTYITQALYLLLLSKPNIVYSKQSRRRFYIENDVIIPNIPIRVCYIEKMEWQRKIINNLQVSLCTSFLQDHQYGELVVILSTIQSVWIETMEENITKFIKINL